MPASPFALYQLRRDGARAVGVGRRTAGRKLAIAGRESGFADNERRTVVLATGRSYREAMAAFAGMRNLEVWYASLPVERAFREFSAADRLAVVGDPLCGAVLG